MKRWIPFMKSHPTVAVIRLAGVIAAGGRGALNDETLAPIIEKAFKRGKPAAVALVINSPGGSPVQSSLIGARIRRLADEKDIPVYAFVEDVKRLKSMLGDIHENFIAHVKARRSGKLSDKFADEDLFNGEIWVGRAAIDVGLIDGIAHIMPKMREIFGEKVQFRRYGTKRGVMQRLGMSFVQDALSGIEERAEYARYGL
jgi:serine protease SohB